MSNKTEIKVSDISSLSVNKLIDSLSILISNASNSGISFKSLPAIMLWGMPGVGKSQAVRAIAQNVQRNTGKKAVVTDVRLLLFNPIDLRGIPVADVTHSFAIWLKPKIFDMKEDNDTINFLFLDEISAAPPSVQAAAYQITLDRVIGEHKLPDNCFVICAGNRVTDKSVAYKMPKALANRLCHFEVQSDFQSWYKWAVNNDIDFRIVSFLQKRQDLLTNFNPAKDDVAFATPRSWEMLSNVLKLGGYKDLENSFPIIAGLVGSGIATEFISWCKTNVFVPDIDSIVAGKRVSIPKSADVAFVTVQAMISFIKTHPKDKIAQRNCISYSLGFSPDFTASFFKELLLWDKTMMYDKQLSDWVKTHAKYFI